MKWSTVSERQYVRVRPTLPDAFDFGPVVDLLPGNRLRVRWVINQRRCAIVDAQDVIGCGQLGEDFLLRHVDEQIKASARQPSRDWNLSKVAIGDAVEYWLNLRRDGCNVQVEDFNGFVTSALQRVMQEAKPTNIRP